MTDYRKLFDLAGKTAVVLGAASGIREQDDLAEAAVCDAANAADVAALATRAMLKFPRLDIAVTTPGLNIRKTILDYTEEDLDRVINLNINGTVHRAEYRRDRADGAVQGPARNLQSIRGAHGL